MTISEGSFKIIDKSSLMESADRFDVEYLWSKIHSNLVLHSQKPSIIAGPVDFNRAEEFYKSRKFNIPEAGCLTFKNCQIVGYGLVVSNGYVLLDENFTMPPKEIGHFGYFTEAQVDEDSFCLGRAYESAGEVDQAVLLMRRGDNVHGHWLLEILPRVPLAQEIADDRAVYVISEGTPAYQIDMLSMLGIPKEKIIKIGRYQTLRCKNLVVPSVAHTNNYWVNPFANHVYDRLLGAVLEEARDKKFYNHYSKIFVTRSSRTNDPRPVIDGDVLERTAVELGYTIIDPGSMGWRDQIEAFSRAEQIVGYLGSGLHNTVFSGSKAHVLAIQSNQTWNHLQTSIASIRGHQISYLFGESLDGFNERSWETAYRVEANLLRLILQRAL